MTDTSNPLTALSGFFFGNDKNDPRVNPQLRQRIALAMMARGTKYPKNLGEGLSAIGEAIGDRGMQRMLEQQDLAQQGITPPPAAGPAQGTSYAPPSDDLANAPAVKAIEAATSQPQVIPPPAPPSAPPPQAPGRGFTPVPMQPGAGEIVDPGEYNAIDAADPRNRYKPAPAYLQPALERNIQDPERRGYLGQLAAKEDQTGRGVSPTGAAGPFQFTGGTGAQYGIPGDKRFDPDASTLAANALTDDNVKALTARLGREPAPGEMALAHQQGAGTAANMLTGAGNAPARNLAVNNVSPSLGPQAAAQKVMGYYGMPGPVGGGRDAVAAALLQQQQPQPPQRPSVADYGQPPVLAFTGADTGNGIQAAPPSPSGIRAAPPQQVAQAQPQAIPGYVPPEAKDPSAAPIIGMKPREVELRNWLVQNQNNPYAAPKVAAELNQLEAERTIRQNEANELYKANIARTTKQNEQRQQAMMDQASRQQTYQKGQQELISGGGGATSTATDPRLLGTPQSPQRTGIPTAPPVPAGITPKEWSEKQTPVLVNAVSAVEKATPQFTEMMDLLKQAREHPGREWGVGKTSDIARRMPGTDAYGFGKIMDQITGKNFLNAYQSLKGGGSITEIEGSKAEAAQARLSTAQNKPDFDKAMVDFENAVRQDMETVQRKVNRPVTAWRKAGDNETTAPDVGQRIGNKEYIGGNPADPMSWRRVQ